MSLGEALLPEFVREMANCHRTLERVPEHKFDWKPHDKSLTLVGLTTHLANLPRWAVIAIERENFDIAPVDGDPPRQEPVTSLQAALDMFDGLVASARSAIASAGDEHLLAPWSLLAGGNPVFTLPRIAVIRSMVLNHMIHHRGQLTVYLRLNDVPLPALYGSSADETASNL